MAHQKRKLPNGYNVVVSRDEIASVIDILI